MSSTNRSNSRNTHISDYYVTPQDCIKDFFNHWLEDLDYSINVKTALVFDPCAGGDKNHAMSYPAVIESVLGGLVDTMDIRDTSLADKKEDYLLANISRNFYDIIITNPPFNLAQQIIEKALQDVKDGGYVIMLLRLNFFGSKQRFDFWKKQLPMWAYIHHHRMSFTDDGKTDSIEYMHAVWKKGSQPAFTMTKVI